MILYRTCVQLHTRCLQTLVIYNLLRETSAINSGLSIDLLSIFRDCYHRFASLRNKSHEHETLCSMSTSDVKLDKLFNHMIVTASSDVPDIQLHSTGYRDLEEIARQTESR